MYELNVTYYNKANTTESQKEILQRKQYSDYALSGVLSFLAAFIFIVFNHRLLHWFIVPLIGCGTLIGADAIRWLRGYYDVLDIKGILGLIGVNFFFLAPLILVIFGYKTKHADITLEDYRPWLGIMAVLNFIGILFYLWGQKWMYKRTILKPRKMWVFAPKSAGIILVIIIIIGLFVQLYFMATEGITGLLHSFEERFEVLHGTGIFRTWMVGNLPLFILYFLTMYRLRDEDTFWKRQSLMVVIIVIIPLIILKFISGGLMGSRGATVWTVFYLVGVIHYFWRPFRRIEALAGLCLIILFMWIYGFYKHGGVQGWQALREEGLAARSAETGRSITGILIGDMSRADVQSLTAYILIEKPYPYKYRYGTTLIGDTCRLIPIWIWPSKYNLTPGVGGKREASTELLKGPGTFNPYKKWEQVPYIYGLAGYVALNFGLLPIPLGFFVLGMLTGKYRGIIASINPGDLRLLLAPIFLNLIIYFLMNDGDNILGIMRDKLLPPLFIVLLISHRFFLRADESDLCNISYE